jgi:ribosome recycling factor
MSDELVGLVLDEAGEKMDKAVAHTRSEFAGVRSGRASSALVERLNVEYYGVDTPMRQLASFSVPEARQLLISPFDKSSMAAIEKAIRNSELGLNPSNDGNVIRLSFPPLTAERRKELVKMVKGMAEEGRIQLRNVRRTARHELGDLEKDGDVTEDELARAEKDLDKVIHSKEAEIDQALQAKEQELLEP